MKEVFIFGEGVCQQGKMKQMFGDTCHAWLCNYGLPANNEADVYVILQQCALIIIQCLPECKPRVTVC